MLIFSPHYFLSSKTRGFTLAEMLVVLAIIGILASIILVNLNAVKIKARDARRLKDLDTIQAAVEQYYRDVGHYPTTGVAWTSFDAPAYKNNPVETYANISAALAPYLPTAPTDPSGAAGDAGYLYRSDDGSGYCILIYKTPENLTNYPAKYIPATRCGSSNTTATCSANGTNGSAVNAIWTGSSGTGAGMGNWGTAGC